MIIQPHGNYDPTTHGRPVVGSGVSPEAERYSAPGSEGRDYIDGLDLRDPVAQRILDTVARGIKTDEVRAVLTQAVLSEQKHASRFENHRGPYPPAALGPDSIWMGMRLAAWNRLHPEGTPMPASLTANAPIFPTQRTPRTAAQAPTRSKPANAGPASGPTSRPTNEGPPVEHIGDELGGYIPRHKVDRNTRRNLPSVVSTPLFGKGRRRRSSRSSR